MRPDSYRWPLIATLTAIAALNYCDRMVLSAVYPLVRVDLGVSDRWLGYMNSAFLWSYALGSPVAGWISDRVPRGRLVLFSLVGWSLVTLVTGLARDANQLLATRLLLGLAECAYLPAAVGLLADHHGPRHRGTAIGIHTAGLGLGTIAGATISGYLGERHGWRSSFLLFGAIGLALSLVAAVVLRKADRPAAHPPADDEIAGGVGPARADRPDRAILKVPGYWVVLIQAMIMSIVVQMFNSWMPLYFNESFGMSLAGAGFWGTALIQIPGVLGVIAGGSASDALARGGSARRMLLQAACYALAAPTLLAFAGTSTFALVSVALVGFSLLRNVALSNENPLLCDLLSPRQRSTAVGLMNMANCGAGAFGVLATGFLKEAGYGLGPIFAGLSAIILMAAIINFSGYRFVLPRDLRNRIAKGETP